MAFYAQSTIAVYQGEEQDELDETKKRTRRGRRQEDDKKRTRKGRLQVEDKKRKTTSRGQEEEDYK